MKKIGKYLLICFFLLIGSTLTLSCSEVDDNPNESSLTETEKSVSGEFESSGRESLEDSSFE